MCGRRRAANARRPVLVYIYGGGFSSGSGDVPVYDGSHLAAEQGLVVVNMNYRVGSLGFFAHPELTKEAGASGNYGLMDQVAALQWVRDNIAAFGGDPRRVMIAGQSAGAMSVYLLTASPMAKGLFQRAAIESGPGGLAAFGIATGRVVTRPRADAEKEGVAYATKLGVAPSASCARCLRRSSSVADDSVPSSTVASSSRRRRRPSPPAGRTTSRRSPGSTPTKASAGPGYGKATADAFRKQVEQRYGERAARILATYPAGTDEEAHAAAIQSARDAGVAGVERLLTERAQTSRMRRRSRTTSTARSRGPSTPSSAPSTRPEVPYVFGTLDVLKRPWTDVDRTLSQTMMDVLGQLRRDGEPERRWRSDAGRRSIPRARR